MKTWNGRLFIHKISYFKILAYEKGDAFPGDKEWLLEENYEYLQMLYPYIVPTIINKPIYEASKIFGVGEVFGQVMNSTREIDVKKLSLLKNATMSLRGF